MESFLTRTGSKRFDSKVMNTSNNNISTNQSNQTPENKRDIEMATILEQTLPPSLPLSRPATPPCPPHITLNTSIRGTPAAIPNKHLESPVSPVKHTVTSTVQLLNSPQSPTTTLKRDTAAPSLLHPPVLYDQYLIHPELYLISAEQVADAIRSHASQPLPDPKYVFPWLHGLMSDNAEQLGYFFPGTDGTTPSGLRRRLAMRRPPMCLRGITVVKAKGDLIKARLRGSILPDEILSPENEECRNSMFEPWPRFVEAEPLNGMGIRNFGIQTSKMATVSDIIVYGDELTSAEDIIEVAKMMSIAQDNWSKKMKSLGYEPGKFHTFMVLEDSFSVFEEKYPDLVAVDSRGVRNESITEFFNTERTEMATMTAPSEIAPHVFLGPTPDPTIPPFLNGIPVNNTNISEYDVLIEASDLGSSPNTKILERLKETIYAHPRNGRQLVHLDVPGSGTIQEPRWNQVNVDGLISLVKWMYEVSTGEELEKEQTDDEPLADREWSVLEGLYVKREALLDHCMQEKVEPDQEEQTLDSDGDTIMTGSASASEGQEDVLREAEKIKMEDSMRPDDKDRKDLHKPKDDATEPKENRQSSPKRILLHCPDGYTETSLLAVAYTMFAHGLTVGEAWVSLHVDKKRNFFAYPSDVTLLKAIQPRILSSSPAFKKKKEAEKQQQRETSNDDVEKADLDPLNILSIKPDPVWLTDMYDGSLPSRILPHLYLGNLTHAKTPALLKQLGIKRILSVGENIDWREWKTKFDPPVAPTEEDGIDIHKMMGRSEVREFAKEGFDILKVGGIALADNGIDGLITTFDKCMEFIDRGKEDGAATLVHCRVGVSRSATICIAYAMREMDLSFPRAYCFVRARRLNVIIQPHLRFVYELLKWEEEMCRRRGETPTRELEWASVSREIAAMNRPYTRG